MMDNLQELDHNVTILLERYRALQEEISALKSNSEKLREEIIRSHSELETLRRNYKHLQDAMGLIGADETREAARRHLTQLIAEIDNALEILKQ